MRTAQRVWRIGLGASLLAALPLPAHASQAGSATSSDRSPVAETPALAPAQAEPAPLIQEASRLRFNGYGTVGLSWIDQPENGAFRRDISESGAAGKSVSAKIDSRLGLQLNYAVNDQIELVSQVVLRARNDHKVAAAFEWAFAAWRPSSAWTVRVGRINPDAFLLSDYRNVGFAYPWIRPEVGFYGGIPLYSVTGADIAHRWGEGDTWWHLKGYVGAGKVVTAPEQDASPAATVRLEPSLGLALAREAGGLTLKTSVSRMRVSLENVPQLRMLDQALATVGAMPIPAMQADVADRRRRLGLEAGALNFIQLGARYEGDNWLWSAEFANIWGDYPTGHMLNGYFSLGRRLGAVTVFGVIAASRSRDPVMTSPQWGAQLAPLLGPEMAAQVQQVGDGTVVAINALRQQQRSLSLGLRWDVSPRLALKAQWDRYLVEANGGRAFRMAANQAGSVNVASIAVDFVF